MSSSIFSPHLLKTAIRSCTRVRPRPYTIQAATSYTRVAHHHAKMPAITASRSRLRPTLQRFHQPATLTQPTTVPGYRTIFIQTESTPNADVSDVGCCCLLVLITIGAQIPPQPSNITSGFIITVPRISLAEIDISATTSFTACCSIAQYWWNHLGILWTRLHHCHQGHRC